MSSANIKNLLAQIYRLISSHRLLPKSTKARLLQKVQKAQYSYTNLHIPNQAIDLYSSLLKRAGELIGELKRNKNQKELVYKTTNFLRYMQASVYDFRADLSGINYYKRLFIVTAVLFMALTPQFYGPVLPLVFVIPIYAGLKGINRRSHSGFSMTLAVIPMALMSGITWIRYIFEVALPDFNNTVESSASMWNVAPSTAQLLIIIPGILSVAMVAASLSAAYLGYKYRDIFV